MNAPLSLRPEERLKKKSQFRKVYKEGGSVAGSSFKLILAPNELPYNRVGFTIQSKKIRLATRRVRVKRLLKEVYRQNKPRIKKGFDIVIIAKQGAQKLDFSGTSNEALYLFKKAKVL